MITAREIGLAACPSCGSASDATLSHCRVCGRRLHLRRPASLQAVWAFWFAGLIAYVPANIYPMMITQSLTGDSPQTILGGVITLIHYESYAIAFVVFAASFLVPVSKFAIIAWLSLSIQFNWPADDHQRHRAHHVVEFIGRWSMIDVFVVAALAALIQLGGIIAIAPGAGISAFGASVVLTMLSASALDPRLIWDRPNRTEEPRDAR